MNAFQRTIHLKSRSRGCHLVTQEILDAIPEIKKFKIGTLNVFLQHTSASLTMNENFDKDVRKDMEDALCRIAPENVDYRHAMEGKDDMPAHIKSSLVGTSLTIPVIEGALAVGTWQGIYLCEHRINGGSRRCVVTIFGTKG